MTTSIDLAPEQIAKSPSEIRKIDFNFENKMANGETISSAGTPTKTPNTGSLTIGSTAVSGQIAQLTLSSGNAEVQFEGDTDNVITATSHGLVVGDTVRFRKDDTQGALPAGITEGRTYWVLTAPSANTLTVSTEEGGVETDITAAGGGVMYREWILNVSVTTSESQTLNGKGRIWVRG